MPSATTHRRQRPVFGPTIQKIILSRMRRWGYLFEKEVLTEKKKEAPKVPTLVPEVTTTTESEVVPEATESIDESVLARHGLTRCRFLLAVASANPTKNLAALVAAFARLPADPALRLVIVGGHNPRVFAAATAADPPGVVRTGPVAGAALKALYGHATALVFPSLYEGFGLPPLEAMACGCPVAAARAAAIPEVCGDAALYFDPHSVDAITAALQRLVAEAPLREQLRTAGLARAGLYRWSAAAVALRAELSAMCAAATPGTST